MERNPFSGEWHQPLNEEKYSILCILVEVIDASHLNTLDPALSIEHKFGGELRRPKEGILDFSSISQFTDGVERVLRDLYGESDDKAISKVRSAIFTVVWEFTKYVRNDLWQEHCNTQAVDFASGVGHGDQPQGISGSDCRQAAKASYELACRARSVRANPTAFSKYTIEFVKELDARWDLEEWLLRGAPGYLGVAA
jgi:hypothetical protein